MVFKYKNRLFIVVVVVTNTIGNLFLAIGLARMPGFSFGSILGYLLAFLSNGWILGGITLMTLWMISQLSMYTWADLTYVLPVTASSYILTAILGRYVLNQHISLLHWAGIIVISFGVMFVSETPVHTSEELEEHTAE